VKYVIFLLLTFVMTMFCKADFTSFDFSLGRYIVDEGKDTKVILKFSLFGYEKEDFLVRPVLKNGIVDIFNSKDGIWISSDTTLTDLPKLENSVVIRIKGLGVEKSGLYFEIFNTVNGESYKTPEKTVWSGKVYSEYIESVNKVLDGNKVLKDELNSQQLNYLDEVKIDSHEIMTENFVLSTFLGKIGLLLIYMFSFFISYYIGYKREGKKLCRRLVLDASSRIYGVSGKIH